MNPDPPPPPPSRRWPRPTDADEPGGSEPSDDEVFHLDLPLDEAADEDEKEQALRELLDFASDRKPSQKPVAHPAAKPPVKAAVKSPVKSPGKLAASDPDVALDIVPTTPEQERLKEAAIREVVEAAARSTRAVELAKPMESYRSRPIILTALAIPCLLLSLYTFSARPEWVFGPKPVATLTARGEAHVRFAMYLVYKRLNAFRAANGGALPQSLLQVGEEWPAIQYRIVADSVFELRAPGSARPIVFRSDGDPRALLGASAGALRDELP